VIMLYVPRHARRVEKSQPRGQIVAVGASPSYASGFCDDRFASRLGRYRAIRSGAAGP
jgi:hypothetical protein